MNNDSRHKKTREDRTKARSSSKAATAVRPSSLPISTTPRQVTGRDTKQYLALKTVCQKGKRIDQAGAKARKIHQHHTKQSGPEAVGQAKLEQDKKRLAQETHKHYGIKAEREGKGNITYK